MTDVLLRFSLILMLKPTCIQPSMPWNGKIWRSRKRTGSAVLQNRISTILSYLRLISSNKIATILKQVEQKINQLGLQDGFDLDMDGTFEKEYFKMLDLEAWFQTKLDWEIVGKMIYETFHRFGSFGTITSCSGWGYLCHTSRVKVYN